MAFGDLKGGVTAISVAANSITNPTDAVGSVAVVVGDLVFVVVGEQTTLTATTVTDNLGNTYTATNAGTDAGTSTGRAYYSRVTVAGTLTTVHVAATGSTDNVAIDACVFTGPFAFLPLDANPSNITTQTTSPFTAPATGTLAQASELVVSWAVATGSTVWSATSPNTLGAQTATQAILHTVIGYQTVSATTTVAPAFTAGSNPTDSVLGTSSFKQDLGSIGDTGYLKRSQWRVPRTHLRDFSTQATFQDDTSLARNPFRLRRTLLNLPKYRHDLNNSTPTSTFPVGGTQNLTPSLFTNINTFYTPVLTLQELPAGSVPAPGRRRLPIPRTHLRDFSVSPFIPLLNETALVRAPFGLRRSFNKPKYKHDATQGTPLDTGAVTQTLTPSLYVNTNTFYTPIVSLQELPAAAFPTPARRKLPVPRHKDESIVGATYQLLFPSLYTNTNTFYTPIVNLQELPAAAFPARRERILPIPRHKNESVAGATYQQLLPSLYTNTNVFYSPVVINLLQESTRSIRVRKRLFPARHRDATSTFSTTIFPQTLSPSLYTNTNSFHVPFVIPLLQEFVRDIRLRRRSTTTKVHRDFSVSGNQLGTTQTLTPSLYTNTNTFYQPTVTIPDTLVRSPIRLRRTIAQPKYRHDSTQGTPLDKGVQTLTPSLYTNTNTFYIPVVTLQELPAGSVPPIRRRLFPARHRDFSIAGSISTDQTLTPSLYTNTNTFYSPTVTAGVVTLTPSLYTNVNTFYIPVVTLQEFPSFNILPVKRQSPTKVHRDHSVRATYIFDQTLTPDLYINDNTFYSPTLTRAGVNLLPDTYINTNTFYIPTISTGSVSLDPSLYTNVSTFYVPVVLLQELPAASVAPIRRRILPIPRYKSESVSGSTSFDQNLTPSLYTNTNTFYSPTITTGGVDLDPSLFVNDDAFYSPTISLQELPAPAIAPIRRRIHPRRYIDPSIGGTQLAVVILLPSLYVNADTFYTPFVSSTYSLHPDLFTNDNAFYTPVALEGQTLLPSLYTNSNTFYVPVITQGPAVLRPTLYINTDIFYVPSVIVPPPPPPPTIVGGVIGQGYRPPKVVNVITNGILFTVPISILPGEATTVSLLPGKVRINVAPEIRPFMNSVETSFTVVGTAKGTDILEDNMDDLMLILSQILLD